MVRLLLSVYRFIMPRLRGNRLLIRWLFGVSLPRGLRVSWDFTTLVLRRALQGRVSAGMSALEVGVGKGALLSIYLARRLGGTVDGVDIVPERVQCSREVAEHNHVPLCIWESDLFASIERRYDLILFNTPYIPTEVHDGLGILEHDGEEDLRATHGGRQGTEVIARFLAEAPRFLTPGGEILMGVNNFYVPDQHVARLIESGVCTLIERISLPLNPSAVYVLALREDSDGR